MDAYGRTRFTVMIGVCLIYSFHGCEFHCFMVASFFSLVWIVSLCACFVCLVAVFDSVLRPVTAGGFLHALD